MLDLIDTLAPVNLDTDAPAETTPIGPTADDARWAAENLNDDWQDLDDELSDVDFDRWAEEAAQEETLSTVGCLYC